MKTLAVALSVFGFAAWHGAVGVMTAQKAVAVTQQTAKIEVRADDSAAVDEALALGDLGYGKH